MSDLIKDVDRLKRFYVSPDMLREKDVLKDEVYRKTTDRIALVSTVPLLAQLYQISLVGVPERFALYRRVASFKWFSFAAAIGIMVKENSDLMKKWRYFDRYFPEPTGLQRAIRDEAALIKEYGYQAPDPENIEMDSRTRTVYERMYELDPSNEVGPDEETNPVEPARHYETE